MIFLLLIIAVLLACLVLATPLALEWLVYLVKWAWYGVWRALHLAVTLAAILGAFLISRDWFGDFGPLLCAIGLGVVASSWLTAWMTRGPRRDAPVEAVVVVHGEVR